MTNRLFTQIKEFCAASTQLHSYNIPKNPYIWFGFLWGVQVPVAALLLYWFFNHQVGTLSHIWNSLSPGFRFFFYCYPIVFACIFGILGTIRKQKDTRIYELIDELKITSITDPLTGLNNRRHLIKAFNDDLARSLRSTTPLSLIFIDIDHFKRTNDDHGHHVGDEVLKKLANILKVSCRPYDIPCRWGGEEFILLLPGVGEESAADIGDRIRIEVEQTLTKMFSFSITISIGVSQYTSHSTFEVFIDQADRALYAAKEGGRNRVIRWSSISS